MFTCPLVLHVSSTNMTCKVSLFFTSAVSARTVLPDHSRNTITWPLAVLLQDKDAGPAASRGRVAWLFSSCIPPVFGCSEAGFTWAGSVPLWLPVPRTQAPFMPLPITTRCAQASCYRSLSPAQRGRQVAGEKTNPNLVELCIPSAHVHAQ